MCPYNNTIATICSKHTWPQATSDGIAVMYIPQATSDGIAVMYIHTTGHK